MVNQASHIPSHPIPHPAREPVTLANLGYSESVYTPAGASNDAVASEFTRTVYFLSGSKSEPRGTFGLHDGKVGGTDD